MKKIFVGIALITMFLVCSSVSIFAAQSWELISPDGSIVADINLSDEGSITWFAELEGREVLHESPVGIYTNYADFRNNLVYVSKVETTINETYPMYSGKFSTNTNHANELAIRFSRVNGDNTRYIQYIFRAYNDGVAVRYFIEGEGTTTNAYNADGSTFESTGLQLLSTDTINATVYQQSYEPSSGYQQFNGYSSMTNNNGYNLPILVTTAAGDNLLFTQADLDASYVGVTAVRPSNNGGLMRLRPCINQGSTPVNITLPFTSPWRVAVIGSLADINETQLIENLAPECQIDDPSWIESGITSWAWLTRGSYPQDRKQTWIDLIDFAAEIGWKYVLMDDGWQPGAWSSSTPINTYYDWFDEVIEYANKKDVGLLAWVHQSRLNTPAKRELLKEWSAKGIKGIKTDFFDSEAQTMLQVYDDITKAAADAKLIVNYHGSNVPNGERRTWPNVMSKEAVYGAEQSSTSATQDCVLPFTRNAIGPMDFTPLQDPWFSASGYTTAHNTAMAITVENGIQCLADYPNAYLGSPARDYFYKMPSKWDETKCIGAELRNYFAVARRSGDTWYVGAVNGTTARANQSISLSFLGAGTYYAQIITEGATRSEINYELRKVTASDVITVNMSASSGAAMKITKNVPYSILEQTIQLANKELQINASSVVRYISVRAAAETFKAEIASKEALIGASISIEELNAANSELLAAIDVFSQAVKAASHVELKSPWYIKYPLSDKVIYNSTSSVTIYGEAGEWWDGSLSNRKDVQNLHLIDIPNEDNITIEVDLDFNPTANYQAAGLVFMRHSAEAQASLSDDFNVNTAMKRHHSSYGNRVFMWLNRAGGGASEGGQVAAGNGPCKLRIIKTGNSFQAARSEDGGATWTNIGSAQTNNNLSQANSPTIRVGIFAYRGGAASIPATFTDFKINGVVQPFIADFIKEVEDIEIETMLGTPPELPSTVTATYYSGSQAQINVVWDEIDPDKYNSRGTFVVYGTVEGTNIYVAATVTTSRKSVDSIFLLADEDKDLNYLLIMAAYNENNSLLDFVSKHGTVSAGESEWVSSEIDNLVGITHNIKTFLWDSDTYIPIKIREDNTVLKAVIANAQKLDVNEYTRLSADGFLDLIDEAIALAENNSATQEEISSIIGRIGSFTLERRYLTGIAFGTEGSYNNSGLDRNMPFDGDINTFFDHGNGTVYAGIDLGEGNESIVKYIKYYPRIDDRQDIVNRLRNARIKAGNTAPTSVNDAGTAGTLLYTVPNNEDVNVKWYTATPSDTTTAFRYFWIYNTSFYGNISELQFWPTNPDDSDITLLNDRIAYAESLTASDYTSASWDAMNVALAQAKALSATTAQSNVDTAALELKAAITQLVLN